jgi:hypothetical protein
MNNNMKTIDIINGKTLVVMMGRVGDVNLEIDVTKKNAITKKPINPAIVDKI